MLSWMHIWAKTQMQKLHVVCNLPLHIFFAFRQKFIARTYRFGFALYLSVAYTVFETVGPLYPCCEINIVQYDFIPYEWYQISVLWFARRTSDCASDFFCVLFKFLASSVIYGSMSYVFITPLGIWHFNRKSIVISLSWNKANYDSKNPQ